MSSKKIERFLTPIHRFFKSQSSAGLLLFAAALIAIIWSNSPFAELYHSIWEYKFGVSFAGNLLSKSLHHWINDGLMAMFFFLVGLEIKREVLAGELSEPRNAILPLVAAIGGMLVPALIYSIINTQGEAQAGWGIPMATDIAFALGILSLLGPRVPLSLKIFLTVLAIIDDLGAVLVIAFFYSSDISILNLSIGALALAVLSAANYLGVRSILFYGVVGIGGVWLAFLLSGVHATIAGILAAFAIPARAKIDEAALIQDLNISIKEFQAITPNSNSLLRPEQLNLIGQMKHLLSAGDTPLQRLEHNLHPFVAFFILPLFALANAGVTLDFATLSPIFHPVSLGIISGLLVGKFVGVFGFCLLAVRLKLAQIPKDLNWGHIAGAALLAGVGFTMSLFITNLAFEAPELVLRAKLGILPASLISGFLGFLVLRASLAGRNR